MRPHAPRYKSLADLSRFLGVEDQIGNAAQVIFAGLTTSTKYIEKNDLFVALPGSKSHGANFTAQAKENGAIAILTDVEGLRISGEILPAIVIEDPRVRVGDVASWFYEAPFNALHAVGITGTNGKTTTAALLNEIWNLSNRESGCIGTVGISIGKENFPTNFTTPESTELQSIVASMVERSTHFLVMEVSSHAISQDRINGARFKNVAFTNLTQDHLDYHGSMQNYFATKAELFSAEFADQGFINIDNPYGIKLLEISQIPVQTVSRNSRSATWHYVKHEISSKGYEVSIRGVGGILIEGFLPLLGSYNLDNALMAIALAVDSGVDPLAIGNDLSRLKGPAGRLERVDIGQKFLAFVDYAHTPDAVEQVLAAVREITSGRVIGVLGCGGDRDNSKRPLMGKALTQGCDFAVMTSDNPRSENPEDILRHMSTGIDLGTSSHVEPDRRGAIAIAVAEAEPGDCVIVLGKGHEIGQEISGIKYPFDDRLELARAIERLT